MQYFDGELEKFLRAGIITMDNALHYATNAGNLKLQLSDFDEADVQPAGPEVLRHADQLEEMLVEP